MKIKRLLLFASCVFALFMQAQNKVLRKSDTTSMQQSLTAAEMLKTSFRSGLKQK
jgi:hypothetical protein